MCVSEVAESLTPNQLLCTSTCLCFCQLMRVQTIQYPGQIKSAQHQDVLCSLPLLNCLLQQTDLSLNRSTAYRAQGPPSDLCYTDEFLEYLQLCQYSNCSMYWCESRNFPGSCLQVSTYIVLMILFIEKISQTSTFVAMSIEEKHAMNITSMTKINK